MEEKLERIERNSDERKREWMEIKRVEGTRKAQRE
jgi:hypothetical protein